MAARAAWKNQIGPWVEAGYRVIAPDTLGYGQTDKPDEPEEYSLKRLSNDLAALLDHIDCPKAVCLIDRLSAGVADAVVWQVLIGHDWGSVIAGRFVLWHPQRVLGVAQ